MVTFSTKIFFKKKSKKLLTFPDLCDITQLKDKESQSQSLTIAQYKLKEDD